MPNKKQWFLRHDEQDAYDNLVQDRRRFISWPPQYDLGSVQTPWTLVDLVYSAIIKQKASVRACMPPVERVAITLRFPDICKFAKRREYYIPYFIT